MTIKHDALEVLVRVVVGCMPPIGKEKRRANEAHLIACARRPQNIPYNEFRKGLVDGTEMYDAIVAYASSIGKKTIDAETIARYFGSAKHVEKTRLELLDSGVKKDTYFFIHTLFAHTLIPVVVTDVKGDGIFDGIYHGINNCDVVISNIKSFPSDLGKVTSGKTVLTHFPLLVMADPDDQLTGELIAEQGKSEEFRYCCKCLSEKGLDHKKIRMYMKWIDNSIQLYEL